MILYSNDSIFIDSSFIDSLFNRSQQLANLYIAIILSQSIIDYTRGYR